MFKKFCGILCTLMIFFMFYIECSSDYYMDGVCNYTESPLVDKLIPSNGEQNIVSRPEIKIYYSKVYNIDLKSIKLFINYKDVTNKAIITSKYISYTPEKKFKRGVQVAKLQLCDLSQKDNKSTVEWFFTVGSPTYNHYNGIFLDKNKNDNIENSYNDLYNMSRCSNKLDFLSINEKINYKENSNTILKQSNKNWNKLIEARNSNSTNDQFVCLSSFEFKSKINNDKVAKINIFNCDNPIIYNKNLNVENMYKNLYYNDEDLIGQFKSDDNFKDLDFLKYSLYGDNFINLFEVDKQVDNTQITLSFDSYINALENGWHLAPITCTSNEKSLLSLDNNIRTIALCENLTKNDLFDAFNNRRVYVSEDNNLKVDFTINKMVMGSIIENPSNLRFVVSAVDNDTTDKIKKIEIYEKNKTLIKENNYDSNYAKLDFYLNRDIKDNYYYAIITQENNKKTLTAPIWIKKE